MGLTCWLDARNAASTTLTDLSGNGNHFDPGTPVATRTPVWTAGAINDQAGIYYNGSLAAPTYSQLTAGKTSADLISATDFAIFFVYQPVGVDTDATGSTNQGLFRGSSGTVRWGVFLRTSGLIVGLNDGGEGGSLVQVASNTRTQAPHYGYLRHTGGILYLSVDGEPEVSIASANTTPLTDSAYLGLGGFGFNGYIGSVIFYNSALSTAAIARVSAYLRSEWRL